MEDVFFHKEITFRLAGVVLKLVTSQELFSSHDVDTGTRFLLHTIVKAGYQPRRILDLGCGYGAIGLMLKRLYPESAVHMVDRDALAVVYARRNAELNGIRDVTIYGSLGYDDVPEDNFDLIAMNVPGKAGEAVIGYLLKEAGSYLASGGVVAVVVVRALEEMVAGILAATAGVTVILQQRHAAHSVFHYRFAIPPPKPGDNALERGIYHRGSLRLRLGDLEWEMLTARGLDEFDTLGYGSQLIMRTLCRIRKEISRAIIFNPGQGHTAVAVWKLLAPGRIELISRDLLALRYARLNLIRNACPAENVLMRHQVGISGEQNAGLLCGILTEGSNAAGITLRGAMSRLLPGSIAIFAGSSTVITRLVGRVKAEGKLRISSRERLRGVSMLVLEKVL